MNMHSFWDFTREAIAIHEKLYNTMIFAEFQNKKGQKNESERIKPQNMYRSVGNVACIPHTFVSTEIFATSKSFIEIV